MTKQCRAGKSICRNPWSPWNLCASIIVISPEGALGEQAVLVFLISWALVCLQCYSGSKNSRDPCVLISVARMKTRSYAGHSVQLILPTICDFSLPSKLSDTQRENDLQLCFQSPSASGQPLPLHRRRWKRCLLTCSRWAVSGSTSMGRRWTWGRSSSSSFGL